MSDKDFVNSKNLSRLDLNKTAFEIDIYSYWCRIVYNKYEKWNDKSHSHSFWELHLCQTGECQIEIGGEKYVMNKNKFLLLPPKTVHTIIHQSEDFSKFIWGFNINDNFVNMEFLKKYSPILFYDTSADIAKAVLSILENIEKNEFEFYSIIKFQLYYIFVLLARKTNISSNPEIYNKTYDNEIKMIKKYI